MTDYCDGCEVKQLRDDFEAECREALDDEDRERGDGRTWSDRWKLESLINAVLDVATFAGLPANRRTESVAAMVDILEGERGRFERVRRWNKRQEDAANAGKT